MPLNIAENLNRLSRVHERYTRQTDRRQTDGRTIAYSEREFTFAKNDVEHDSRQELLGLRHENLLMRVAQNDG